MLCVTSELSESIAASPSLLTMHPRLYQEELLEKAKEKNIILYLGTGSRKTFIAVMLINFKHMRDLALHYLIWNNGSLSWPRLWMLDFVTPQMPTGK